MSETNLLSETFEIPLKKIPTKETYLNCDMEDVDSSHGVPCGIEKINVFQESVITNEAIPYVNSLPNPPGPYEGYSIDNGWFVGYNLPTGLYYGYVVPLLSSISPAQFMFEVALMAPYFYKIPGVPDNTIRVAFNERSLVTVSTGGFVLYFSDSLRTLFPELVGVTSWRVLDADDPDSVISAGGSQSYYILPTKR